MTTVSPNLQIDWLRCDGHGICAEVAPELISLDDWGFPMLNDVATVDQFEREARDAVALCPALALRIGRR